MYLISGACVRLWEHTSGLWNTHLVPEIFNQSLEHPTNLCIFLVTYSSFFHNLYGMYFISGGCIQVHEHPSSLWNTTSVNPPGVPIRPIYFYRCIPIIGLVLWIFPKAGTFASAMLGDSPGHNCTVLGILQGTIV